MSAFVYILRTAHNSTAHGIAMAKPGCIVYGGSNRKLALAEMSKCIPIYVLETLVAAFIPSGARPIGHRAMLEMLISVWRDNCKTLQQANARMIILNSVQYRDVQLFVKWFGHLDSRGTPKKVATKSQETVYAHPPDCSRENSSQQTTLIPEALHMIFQFYFNAVAERGTCGALVKAYCTATQVCRQWHGVLRQKIPITAAWRLSTCVPLDKAPPLWMISRIEHWLASRFVFRPRRIIVDAGTEADTNVFSHFISAILAVPNQSVGILGARRFVLEDGLVRVAEAVAATTRTYAPGAAALALAGGAPQDTDTLVARSPNCWCCAVCASCQSALLCQEPDVPTKQVMALRELDLDILHAKHESAAALFDCSAPGVRKVQAMRAQQIRLGFGSACRNGGPAALIPPSWYVAVNGVTPLERWSLLTLAEVGIDEPCFLHTLASMLLVQRSCLTAKTKIVDIVKQLPAPRIGRTDNYVYRASIARDGAIRSSEIPPDVSIAFRRISLVVNGKVSATAVSRSLNTLCGPFRMAGDVFSETLDCTGAKGMPTGVSFPSLCIQRVLPLEAIELFVQCAFLCADAWAGTDPHGWLRELRLPSGVMRNTRLSRVVAGAAKSLEAYAGPSHVFGATEYPRLVSLEVSGPWCFQGDIHQMPKVPHLQSLVWKNTVPLFMPSLLATLKTTPQLTVLEIVGSGNRKMADASVNSADLHKVCQFCPHLKRVCLKQALYQFTPDHALALAQLKGLVFLHLELRKRVRARHDSEKIGRASLDVLLSGTRPLTLSITPNAVDPLEDMETSYFGTPDRPYRTTRVIVNRHVEFAGRGIDERLSGTDADIVFPGTEAADMRYRQHIAAIADPSRRRRFVTRWVQTN